MIAHPCLHGSAGGTGTYSDPITFATDVTELPWCAVIYVPYMPRHFIHEDECGQCDQVGPRATGTISTCGPVAKGRRAPSPNAVHSLVAGTPGRGRMAPTDPNDPTILVNPPANLPVVTLP